MTDQATELRRMMGQRAQSAPDGARHAGPARAARTIAVSSGKGGVGKTSLALNLGLALAGSGTRTALLDADWGLSNTEVLLGIAPARDLRHVVRGECRLADIVQEAPMGLRLIPGASGVAELANLTAEQRQRLFEELTAIGETADVVLLDMSPGIADAVIDLAAGVDEVLLLTTPEPTALTDAYAFAKMLLNRRPEANLGLVVNMADSAGHAGEIARGFASVTERFLNRSVPLHGFVCRDARVREAVCLQQQFLISFPRSVAAGCVRRLADDLMDRPASRPAASTNSLAALLRRLLPGDNNALLSR
jgi:flagellar biosynthesis protein FlhG